MKHTTFITTGKDFGDPNETLGKLGFNCSFASKKDPTIEAVNIVCLD